VQHGGGGWSANVFLPFAKSVTEKKTTAGWIVWRQAKILCKPRGTRGKDFCLPVVALRSCP